VEVFEPGHPIAGDHAFDAGSTVQQDAGVRIAVVTRPTVSLEWVRADRTTGDVGVAMLYTSLV